MIGPTKPITVVVVRRRESSTCPCGDDIVRRIIAGLCLFGITWAVTAWGRADDPVGEGAKAEAERAAKAVGMAREEAGRYVIHHEGNAGDGAARLHPKALLQWSNPVAGSIHGAVFVWTDRGRPAAVGSIYRWFSPGHHMGVELHSLDQERISADRSGRPIWSASRPGAERKPIPGAPAPANNPAGRLRQMRALAKEFEGRETTREGLSRELRLLTQPLYRYESTEPEVIDGGLFAFVEGTDPEIVLLIEVKTSPDGPRWEFAAARMNSITLSLTRRGSEVWSAPTIPWDQARDHREPYSLFIYDPDPGMGPGDGRVTP